MASEVDLRVLAQDADPVRTVAPPAPVEAAPAATPARVAEAIGGGLADRMRARYAEVRGDRTREFPVPGWQGDLVVRARLADRESVTRWMENDAEGDDGFVVLSTEALLMRDENGVMQEIPGGFGPALAELLGLPTGTPPTRLVNAVMADAPMRVGAFANAILDWNRGRSTTAERALGE